MENPDNAWNDIIGNGGSKKNDTIDSVIDAFNSVISTNSDAILGSGWNTSNKKNVELKTKGSEVASKSSWGGSFSTTSNQDESENSWNSWGNGSSSWDNNNNNSGGWGNDDNQNYPTNNINSGYTDDRRNYQDVNKTNSYTDNNNRYYESTDANQVNNDDMHMNNNNNFSKTHKEYDNQTHGQQQHSNYEAQESPSPSESETSTDQNSETISPDDIKMKLSAWHSLADPNTKERGDGLGGGQLHRRGKNYIPVDERTVLAIQQKGGGHRRPSRGVSGKPIPKTKVFTKPPIKSAMATKPINNVPTQKPPATQKILNATVPVKVAAPQNQKQNTQPTPPNRAQQQTQQTSKKPSPPPSQSSQRQPLRDVVPQPSRDTSRDVSQPSRDVSQPSRDTSRPLRNPSPSSRPQRSQQLQQPQLSQQTQQPQKQNSWSPQLVNTPFWESSSPPPSPPPIQHPSPRQYANEAISNKSQPIRHQSPARSPRPAKPVQDYTLPYIPPEFDSTPYRKQPSPSPVRDKPHIYNDPDWKGNKYYEQGNNVENQRNEYYDDYDENGFEGQQNKSGHISRYNEPEKEQASRVDRYDRGELLLTINVELSEGKTQAIEVHVHDDPMDLAKDFCDLWKVTNPVLICLRCFKEYSGSSMYFCCELDKYINKYK
ncbi:hypothetical protein GLOIN_2v1561445 [Rhizophagus irregularis DAOM 181602=DAOM 197198]|uniref:Uncharacterized protein n=1 Tax=Rhizophagus irregularis (strain DAOM 181602 / DAOM 197198 / MUCL 43194) TaxID=747089 RepID=A0A2P4QE37_RHIID|nr:hypothetical protein GLOIN_2v1561445 [Rhizophagus irregularis DAOM 181602=DAOM 197198]POG75894.1 hypothetical protein GLOIN_2v1561445 [Rhizophagus irregularis DAOM 181602=DAOM 197198]|eukprot:XP_025182760.1 hypothetical protein GLOIN_2v1561445 [Rhizophagus irregularis DAOM 181602=DAOM 197198]